MGCESGSERLMSIIPSFVNKINTILFLELLICVLNIKFLTIIAFLVSRLPKSRKVVKM